jgi:peptidase M23-like protein
MSLLRTRRLWVGMSMLVVIASGPAAMTTAGPGPAAPQPSVWPLEPIPTVVRGFDPPGNAWDRGHRGVDLLGSPGQPVMTVGAGDVAFARTLAGRGVVVIRHGALRSTYEPVTAAVQVGEHVYAGQVIGLLQATHSHCAPDTCLHLGLRRGGSYLDPLRMLGPRPVRLKPLAPADLPPVRPAATRPGAGTGVPPSAQGSTHTPGPVHAKSAGHHDGRSGRAQLATRLVAAVVSLAVVLSGRAQARG